MTQFELLTAAAFVAFAEARVKFAVIEAGLGGRLDATNVIPSQPPSSPRSASTTPSGSATPWRRSPPRSWRCCATTRVLIRARFRPRSTSRRAEVERHHATCRPRPSIRRSRRLAAATSARTWRLALAAAGVILGELRPEAVEARRRLALDSRPGELLGGDPPLIFDAAHNADGARALAGLSPG